MLCVLIVDQFLSRPCPGDASSLTMYTGETFSVLSKDEGDGWTKVKRTNGEVGYVPTSYIQIH